MGDVRSRGAPGFPVLRRVFFPAGGLVLFSFLAALFPRPLVAQASSVGLVAPGNCNGDSAADISDIVFLLNHLFHGEGPPPCRTLCDFQQDGQLDVSDLVGFIQYLMQKGAAPQTFPPGACETIAGDAKVEVTWDKVTEDVLGNPVVLSGYRVYARPAVGAPSSYQLLKEVGPDCGCATIGADALTALVVGHYVSITAVDMLGGESEHSAEVFLDW